ncbi:ea22 [Escherichia coli]|nr:ea22 [Escherichia coli]HBD3442841.1 ead/Ea22-like family protein [Escherichia coli]HCS4632033.1 ead/Ea22-like family protein [Escherichia coli]HCS4769957.1 ead/Ea22-like family protein [Escherichia coli]HCS5796096.1 ead/Ea22-like family protein [Escherichia coli]
MSKIDYQALREAAEQAMHDNWGFDADLFHELVTPSIVLALLDERERNQQYIKRRDQENEEIALTVGKLRVELEAAKSKLNEQREYYEGVIADGSKRIAELEEREILLPERSSMLHRTDFHEDYQTVMAYKVSEVIAAIRAAGIRIKGERYGNQQP